MSILARSESSYVIFLAPVVAAERLLCSLDAAESTLGFIPWAGKKSQSPHLLAKTKKMAVSRNKHFLHCKPTGYEGVGTRVGKG